MMATLHPSSSRVSRRLLLQSSLAGAGSVYLGSRLTASARAQGAEASPEPDDGDGPGRWRTWYLSTPAELRPEAPGAPSQAEIDEVLEMQAARTEADEAIVALWGTGPAILAWSRQLPELFTEFEVGSLPQSRVLAHLHTAMHDAAVAAWDARLAHNRPGPAATDSAITPLPGVDASASSFPSEHAAVAGAAAVVLTALFPGADAGRFDALATEAAESRLMAGAAFRSDIDVGLELGRAVGERAAERSRNDNFSAQWDPTTKPSGPGYWEPTPPNFADPAAPLAGSWTPWVMASGDQFRPAPPPEYGSLEWHAELRMVQEIARNRTFDQERTALWWGTQSPPVLLNTWAQELVSKGGLALPHAAQVFADLNVAIADALIAVWDGKYTWWTSRPINEDPDLVTVYPTPPYPAYPGGYGAAMGAGTTILGHYFPGEAVDFENRAWEAANSRAWAGIHYVIDDDVALTMGRRVGRLVAALPGANELGGT